MRRVITKTAQRLDVFPNKRSHRRCIRFDRDVRGSKAEVQGDRPCHGQAWHSLKYTKEGHEAEFLPEPSSTPSTYIHAGSVTLHAPRDGI